MSTPKSTNHGGSRLGAGRPPESLHDRALRRVQASRQLSQYEDFIMADWNDWNEGDEHWQWVLTTPIREIVDWAIAGQE